MAECEPEIERFADCCAAREQRLKTPFEFLNGSAGRDLAKEVLADYPFGIEARKMGFGRVVRGDRSRQIRNDRTERQVLERGRIDVEQLGQMRGDVHPCNIRGSGVTGPSHEWLCIRWGSFRN